MKGWKRSANGTWSFSSNDGSLSLPPDFELDHEAEGIIGFTGTAPDKGIAWVAFKNSPFQEVVDADFPAPDNKVMGVETVSGLDITEIAPTTPSGRAQAKIRIYVVELTGEASLIVIGGGDSFAKSFAQQWGT